MDQSRRAAIDRMAAECAALSRHVVVAVRLTSIVTSTYATEYLQCTAIGAAVRAPGAPALDHSFTADPSGQDFARLGGWVPVGLVLGLAIGVRARRRDDLAGDLR